jgi:hypothetical protein
MGIMPDDAYLRDLRDPFHPLHLKRNGSGSCTTRYDCCELFGCVFGHTEGCYDHRNQETMNYGAAIFRSKQGQPNAPTVMKLECFNKEEAAKAEAYMKRKHPDVPFFATWLTWPHLSPMGEKGAPA